MRKVEWWGGVGGFEGGGGSLSRDRGKQPNAEMCSTARERACVVSPVSLDRITEYLMPWRRFMSRSLETEGNMAPAFVPLMRNFVSF